MRVLGALAILVCLSGPVLADTVTVVLEPWRSVELRSTVNGRIAAMSAREGTAVAGGEVLATVDASVQRARVKLAEVVATATGTLLRADRLLDQARTRLDLLEEARSKGAAQPWEVVAAEQAVAVAEADRLVALDDRNRREAELALERATLSEFDIRAPFDATILEVVIDEGEIVDTGTIIMSIGDLQTLSATAFVPVEWLPDLSPDSTLRADAEGTRVEVTVSAIDPRVDPASRTVRVVLDVANPDAALLPGMTVVVESPG